MKLCAACGDAPALPPDEILCLSCNADFESESIECLLAAEAILDRALRDVA